MIHKLFKNACALVALAVATAGASAQAYPDRPVKIMVAAAAGSSPDSIARTVAKKLGEMWNQTVVVENVVGLGGIVGAERAARQPADGYTLAVNTIGAMSVGESVMAKLPYDPVKDFEPVSLLMSMPNLLVVHPSVPARNLQELIAYAKQNPGKLRYGHPGIGTTPHLSAELLLQSADLKMQGIPYKSSAQMTTDLLAGHYEVLFHNASVVLPHARSGAARALAITSAKRSPALPDMPTVAEAGDLPDFAVNAWWGLYAPAGTPPAIVNKVSADVAKALAQPDVTQWIEQRAGTVGGGSPQDLRQFQAAEAQKWAKVVRSANITPQ